MDRTIASATRYNLRVNEYPCLSARQLLFYNKNFPISETISLSLKLPLSIHRSINHVLDVAEETSKTHSQISLNWLQQRPTVSNIIIGARNEEQIKQNLGAAGWNLTVEQVKRLT